MERLVDEYAWVRRATEALVEPLPVEDLVAQSMPDASPAKWHLAHTTWFFETFVLAAPLRPEYAALFNSYYDAVGPQFARERRGLLTRPTVKEVYEYRARVDEAVAELCGRGPDAGQRDRLRLGLHHEQQHQELLLTDLKHLLAQSPLRPAYRSIRMDRAERTDVPSLRFEPFDGGVVEIGHTGPGFAFDNERPRHRAYLAPFALGSRLVTSGEFRAFVEDGGYRRPGPWLADGFAAARAGGWEAPLYWERDGGRWRLFTLAGMRDLDDAEPVCHVSFYEADAYARWAGARLPTEAEWEHAAAHAGAAPDDAPPDGDALHPRRATGRAALEQLHGACWQWTASAYLPYPGYRPPAGALGEYNGKFMCNQVVLRGSSCATPRMHARTTYRNFFHPDARWQFAGIRLARDVA
jgi:ergothioneine biosynthesis protein EgtB